MTLRVMARARRADEQPRFPSFRRAGIDFPCLVPGTSTAGPVEVTVVDNGIAYADANEVDRDGLLAILKEPMLLIEDSVEVRKAMKPLVAEAEARRVPFVGAKIVKPGAFDAFIPEPEEAAAAAAEGDGLDKMSKPELADMAENMGIADARKLNKGPLIDAIREARATEPEE